MITTIALNGLSFEGRHGATVKERRQTRRFEVDVLLEADFQGAERSDRLVDALDYRDVADIIVEIGCGEPHRLIESLARRMVDSLSERFPSTAITLELRKLAPPGCAGQPRFSAYRIQQP
jgi:7,8-dihydroneopterin aldolase/epimerase/oxygenase